MNHVDLLSWFMTTRVCRMRRWTSAKLDQRGIATGLTTSDASGDSFRPNAPQRAPTRRKDTVRKDTSPIIENR